MTKKFFLYAIAALGALQSAAAQPRLIVQIVVGSMRGEDLDRYAENFGEGGFRRLTEGGTVYADTTICRPLRPSRWPRSPRGPCPRPTA